MSCVILLYLFYMFSLANTVTELNNLCSYMAILSFIIAGPMLCVFMCGALKNLRLINREAGNAAYFEATIFFIA